MKKIFVYDLDDTLYRERDFVFSGFEAVDHWLEDQQRLRNFYPTAEKLFLEGVRGTLFNRVLDELQFPYNEELIQQMVGVYRNHEPHLELLEDARALLEHHAKSYEQAIITDGYYKTQENKIKALRLEGRIPLILCSDQFGPDAWKPSPVCYEKVMEHFQVEGNQCTYIGDNPKKDFITAKKLGWSTIRISRPGFEHAAVKAETPEHEADITLTSIYELTGSFSGTNRAI